MVELNNRKKPANWPELIGRCVVSFVLVLLTQCTQFLVPQFFSDVSVFIQLLLSALMLLAVVGFGGWCRRLFRVRASAPAFVFFSVLFVWVVYIAIVRQDASHLMDFLFNGQIILLIFGLYRMLSSDPGLVLHSSSSSDVVAQSSILEHDTYHQDTGLGVRVRCCQICKAHVKGFDHHCPAFGNCIEQSDVSDADGSRLEISFSRKVASGTMLFSILQLAWQAVFLLWHVYCICFNIRTDEWNNWKRYPEFQVFVQSEQGQKSSEVWFKNPYDKGVLQNVKEFVASK